MESGLKRRTWLYVILLTAGLVCLLAMLLLHDEQHRAIDKPLVADAESDSAGGEPVEEVFEPGRNNEYQTVGYLYKPAYGLDEWGRYYVTIDESIPYERFAVDKPKGTFRIFILGGSFARGSPYELQAGIGSWMREELCLRYPLVHFEVINATSNLAHSFKLRAVSYTHLTLPTN